MENTRWAVATLLQRSFHSMSMDEQGGSSSSFSAFSLGPLLSPALAPIFTGSSQCSVRTAELGGLRGLPHQATMAMDLAAPRFSSLTGFDTYQATPSINQLLFPPQHCHRPLATIAGLVRTVVWNLESLGAQAGEAARVAALVEAPSRFWQGLLEEADENFVDRTLDAVLGFVFELMGGAWGRHLFRKLLVACSEEQLERVVSAVVARPWDLMASAKHKNGRKCAENLLLAVRSSGDMLRRLTAALSVGVVVLMMDLSGHLLVQTCLHRLDAEQNKFIYTAALQNLRMLAKDKYGSPALIKCIEHAPSPTREALVNAVISASACLSQDPCGNYVVQRVVGLEDEEHTGRLCRVLRGHCVQLAMHKNGSHVVERCVHSPAARRHVTKALVSSGKVDQVAIDPYGNYVVQRMLKVLKKSEPELHKVLVRSLWSHTDDFRHHPHGKNVFKLLIGETTEAS